MSMIRFDLLLSIFSVNLLCMNKIRLFFRIVPLSQFLPCFNLVLLNFSSIFLKHQIRPLISLGFSMCYLKVEYFNITLKSSNSHVKKQYMKWILTFKIYLLSKVFFLNCRRIIFYSTINVHLKALPPFSIVWLNILRKIKTKTRWTNKSI